MFRQEIDPITFEVIRHRLWSINDEAAATLRRVSGSPVATEVCDFNTALLTGEGDTYIVGVYMGVLSLGHDLIAKTLLREYSDNPGINQGDMFLCSNPYNGVPHQSDVTVVAPIHWEKELLGWVGSSIHQVDVGGPVKGSQGSIGADSIFQEPCPIPPLKIVEEGVLRKDLEQEYLIRSRTPQLCALDLRAKIAANNVAKRRIFELIEKYGPQTIKGVMSGIINYAEKRLKERLRELPDGTWRHQLYMDNGSDGRTYKLTLALTKEDERLRLDFSDCDRQASALVNCTYGGLKAGVLAALFPYLCYDMPWSPAGALRTLEIVAKEGTVVHASWPAGVAKATTSAIPMVNTLTSVCLAKLLAASEKYRSYSMSPWMAVAPVQELFGLDQRGEEFGSTMLDPMAGGGGAWSNKDGIDTGGIVRSLNLRIANVETYEFRYPLLYLHRRQQADTCGAGKHRGGVGVSIMFTPHGVETIPNNIMHSTNYLQPASVGISGGFPASTNYFTITRNSNVLDLLQKEYLPVEEEEISGQLQVVPGMLISDLKKGEVYRCIGCGGGGYGDPLERKPELVAGDVQKKVVTAAAAEKYYGVFLDSAKGVVDIEKTIACRKQLRDHRRGGSRGSDAAGVMSPDPTLRVTEKIKVGNLGKEVWYLCSCGQSLTPVTRNFKEGALMVEESIQAAGPYVDPYQTGKGKFVFRQFVCPNCATLLETELAREGDPLLWDIEYHAANGIL